MNVAVVYILPHINLFRYRIYARRFSASYLQFPAGAEHKLFVVVNGAKPDRIHEEPFPGVPVEEYLSHTNIGKDIGAYQMFAEKRGSEFDLMICLGTPVHFRRELWLARILEGYSRFGPGLYGAFAFHIPMPHVRTTAFWIPPPLFNAYPYQISNENRYVFEHGDKSITQWVGSIGLPVVQVTWTRFLTQPNWLNHFAEHVPNSDALLLDQHTDRVGFK